MPEPFDADPLEANQGRDRAAPSSRWLIRQLGDKVRHFPRDFLRRLRRSKRKRRAAARLLTPPPSLAPPSGDALPSLAAPDGGPEPSGNLSGGMIPFLQIAGGRKMEFFKLHLTRPEFRANVDAMESYFRSGLMAKHCAQAVALDPAVGAMNGRELNYCAPWHDAEYNSILRARRLIPSGPYDAVILMPFGKLGGADFVAGVLAHALSSSLRTLILRTEAPDWERPDWYPESVASVDLSAALSSLRDKPRALYALLQEIAPKRIYNVNSRLGFEMLDRFSERLATQFRLYAYYFCADRSPEGVEAGYPVSFFANIVPHLQAALIDTKFLADALTERYALPRELKAKLLTIYTPAVTPEPDAPVVKAQLASREKRQRPKLLWAGRLDRQKRFDLLLKIAEAMPDVDFECWGKAVLDAAPDLGRLPANVTLRAPFKTYADLPLDASDGWIYTASWDGLPTILIELAALGMPIAASAVGGVPELIDEETGWPVRAPEDVKAYVTALRAMLGDAGARLRKVEALQARVRKRHTAEAYARRILDT